MLRKLITAGGAAALLLAVGRPLQAQSSYSNAVMSLSPTAYWPLNETTQPPMPLNLTAQNLGTAGTAGNGFYGAWYQPNGTQWYLTNNIAQTNAYTFPFDGSKALNCQGAPGQYVIVPRNTNGVANSAITVNPPFSIEAWVQVGNTNSQLGCIVSQGGSVNLNGGGPDTNNPFYGGLRTNWAGIELGQFQDYFFLLCQNTNAAGVKSSELDAPNGGFNKGIGFKIGAWVHLVATFDGVGVTTIYTNGQKCFSKNLGANGAGQKYVIDPTSPLMIGCGSDATAVYGQGFKGVLHDVAIYNTALQQSSIQTHYETANGTNGTYGSNYTNAVIADSPILYYRLNDNQSQTSAGYPSGTFPVANNYGSLGASGNGLYQPGTTPGVAGPPYAGFGPQSTAVSFNGWLGGVDVGGGAIPNALNPTNTAPLTVVAWFQGGPADSPGRFQEILGHGNNSYRLALGQLGGENHFNPGPGPELQYTNLSDLATNGFALNDGKWHMVAGVSDGTNEYMYLDGILAKSSNNPAGINILGTNTDLLIGGDSQFTAASFSVSNTVRTFDGQVAHVAFWNNALTAANIQQLYNAAGVTPYIVFQPKSTTGNQGQPVTVSATVRGSATLNYQWYKNSTAVSGQTTSTLTYNSSVASESGNYYLVATNGYGSVTSSVISLTVFGPPTVQQQTSTDVEVFSGTSPTLHVMAVGAPPIYYQWTHNGGAISGATNSSYQVVNATANDTYNCTLSNFVGTATLSPIALTVLSDPTAPYPVKVLADGPVDYFRLDEASGTTAYDYAGGNNGIYTNVYLGQPGYTQNDTVQSDPSETSIGVGFFDTEGSVAADNDAGNMPPWLNFGTPNGSSMAFSVEAWFNEFLFENNANGSAGNCIVALGTGNGGEQFVLDTGAASGDVRFFVRNAAGTTGSATGNYAPANQATGDGKWHHMVGVCDEPNGKIYLYLDGVQVGNGTIPVNSGILAATSQMTIGARQSGATVPATNDFQFYGDIDDVAIYNYALSAAQVANHYSASGIGPVITSLLPGSQITTNQGANVTFSATVSGTAPVSFYWLDNNNNLASTNSSYALSNLQPSQAGGYTLIVSNLYGTESTNISLSVDLGPPSTIQDISPLAVTNFATTPMSYTFTVGGSTPFYYHWYLNNSLVAGATNATYSFAILPGTNYYYCAVTNAFSYSQGSGPLYSSTGMVVGLPVASLNPTSYTDKMKITFNGYSRGEILPNFPVLIDLGTNIPGFSYSHFASPSGGDLRFCTDTNGTRVLNSEIDEWNPGGTSTVWVQLPALQSSNDFIWAFWGNPAAEQLPSSDTNGSVWVAPSFEGLPNFDLVYHLKETGLPIYDSTLQYPATNGNAPVLTNGIIGHAEYFGRAQYLDAGFVNLSNQFTLSAWVNMNDVSDIQTIWANQLGGSGKAGFSWYIDSYQTSDREIRVETGNGTSGNVLNTAGGVMSPNVWHQLVCVMDRNTGTGLLYMDGQNIPTSGSIRTDFPLTNDVRFAEFDDNNFGFTGGMDEARIRNGTNSPNWIWASYMNVASNGVFQSYGSLSSSVVVITSQMVNGQLELTWPQGTLQSANQVTGPYSDVVGATSPYMVTPTGPAKFYRVRVH